MKPLEYVRRLTPPTEDTRRVVTKYHPREHGLTPDDKGNYWLGHWRGWATEGGTGIWNTKEVWATEITSPWFGTEGEDWHATRRDVCVDVESTALPEPWWREFFGGLRGRKKKVAQPGGGVKTQDMGAGVGGSIHGLKGDSEYYGSRRSAAFLRIYAKYTREGVDHEVRQEHLDRWHAAGWTGGLVLRVEAVLSPPTPLGVTIGKVTPAELFADACERVRLLDHAPDGRASNVATAERWVQLAQPVKLERPRDPAPDLEAMRLRRAIQRLTDKHGIEAVSLAVRTRRYEQ